MTKSSGANYVMWICDSREIWNWFRAMIVDSEGSSSLCTLENVPSEAIIKSINMIMLVVYMTTTKPRVKNAWESFWYLTMSELDTQTTYRLMLATRWWATFHLSTRPASMDTDVPTMMLFFALIHNFYHFTAVAIIFYGDDFELA